MKRISLLKERQASAASKHGPATSTGSHCPASGLWSPESDSGTVQSFFEGQVFPAFDGAATVWRRVSAGEVSPN